MKHAIDQLQVNELIIQALETERGGIQIYTAAIAVAVNDDVREEWKKYLAETKTHEQLLLTVCKTLDLDPEVTTPGRQVVAHIGASLVGS